MEKIDMKKHMMDDMLCDLNTRYGVYESDEKKRQRDLGISLIEHTCNSLLDVYETETKKEKKTRYQRYF